MVNYNMNGTNAINNETPFVNSNRNNFINDANLRGRPIYYMQCCLRKLSGYYPIRKVLPDGVFGVDTKVAVEDFQRIFNIKINGVICSETYRKIDDEYNKILQRESNAKNLDFIDNNVLITKGEKSNRVAYCQVMLNFAGEKYQNIGKVQVTAVMDEDTISAVKKVQHILGIIEDGIIDKPLISNIIDIAKN